MLLQLSTIFDLFYHFIEGKWIKTEKLKAFKNHPQQ